MKTCPTCKKNETETEFGTRKRRGKVYPNSHCKTCTRIKSKKHYEENKQSYIERSKLRNERDKKLITDFLYEYTRNGCKICGIKDFVCLEFHHRDPSEKEIEINKLVRNCSSIQNLKQELAKCDILCCNCHRKETAKQRKWKRNNYE